MTRTTLLWFVLVVLIWLYFVCCQGLRSGLNGTEKYSTIKRREEKFKGGNRFDLLSKPSRQTRSPKNNDPGVKEGICKVIGFASTGVQFAFFLQSRHPKTALCLRKQPKLESTRPRQRQTLGTQWQTNQSISEADSSKRVPRMI
jgi:hypothetical protein